MPVAEVWPDNLLAVSLFCSIQTQWRMGMGGPVGLDYNVLYHKMDRMHLSDDEYEQIEDSVRTIELEVILIMKEQSSG